MKEFVRRHPALIIGAALVLGGAAVADVNAYAHNDPIPLEIGERAPAPNRPFFRIERIETTNEKRDPVTEAGIIVMYAGVGTLVASAGVKIVKKIARDLSA